MNYFVKSTLALALTVILSGCPSPSPSPAPAPAAAGDTVAPVVVAPTSITVTVAAGNTSAPKTHASIAAFLAGASATDNVDGVITNITNNAPATFPTTAPTTVTFSATDAAGNTGTATATVTVVVSAPVAFNVIDGNGAPIQGAVVRVDQTDYTTDVNGQVLITGADVGLHDIHAFASGYDWASLYQVTANSTGNTFTLYPVTTGSSANIQSQVVVDLNVPAGYVMPPVGMLEYTLTDASGNIFRSASRYPRVYITDPYTGATNIPIYQAQFYTAFPAATPLAGSTLSVAQISCDVNGLNCTSLSFTDIVQTFTTQDFTTLGASATVSLTNNPAAVAVPVTSAKSEVALDLNMTNSLLAVGAVYDAYAAAINAVAVFSVVDATTGQVTDYKGQASINISYATAPSTIASTVASIDFGNIPVGTALTGNLSIVELQNYSDISNFVDLGQKTLTTIQAPYIKTATTFGAVVAMAVPFPAVPAYPAADNTSAVSSGASISATVLNSIYQDPNMSSPLGGYAWIALDLVTQDANGNTKVYTGELNATQVPVYDVYGSIVSFKNGTTSEGSIFFADLPPNTSVTGTLSAVELYYTFSAAGSLGAQQVQYVNLGVTTLTTGQPNPFWKGYKIPVGLPVPTNINVTFPVTPPTATTVLNINSASVPAGMVLTDAFVYSAGLSYVSAVEPVVLPHSFTSLAPITGNVIMRIGAVEPYTQASWFYASSFAAGTTVDIVSSLTAIPSIAANQTGATIQLTPSANTKTFVDLSITDPAISSMQWSILLPATLTSVVLPTPPAGITNYWTVGNTYNLDTSDYVFSGTYAQFAAQYMGNASQQSLLLSSGLEGITSPQVPYQYQ